MDGSEEHKDYPGDIGRRERKRRQQLDHIADTAWRLFETEGFETVTMERIAVAADVSKVTLYRHFPAKEALLAHVFHRDLQQGWPALRPALAEAAPGRTRLARFLELQAQWCERHRFFLLPYTRYRMSDARLPAEGRERSGMEPIVTELIAQGQAAGEFRDDLPAELLAVHFRFAHLAAMLRCLMDDKLSMADELAQMLELFCNGVGVR